MNTITFNSQLYFTSNKFIFWTKFYLLSKPEFHLKYPDGYNLLEKDFHQSIGFDSPLNLDTLTEYTNIAFLIKTIADIISNEALTSNKMAENFFHSYLIKGMDLHRARKLFSRYVVEGKSLYQHFIFLKEALLRKSFYKLSYANPIDFIGEWISVNETGQLRINYNMTDLMPIGNQIRLSIQKCDDAYYAFKCLAKAQDYGSKEAHDINVFETLIKIEQGYFHHYRREDMVFLFKRPVFNFHDGGFTTQTFKIEFDFKNSNNSALKQAIQQSKQ